jgi:hypothetical protein
MKIPRIVWAPFVVAPSLFGCTAEVAPPVVEPPVGQVSSAFTGIIRSGLMAVGPDYTSRVLAPFADWTCFITGVKGNLRRGVVTVAVPPGSTQWTMSVNATTAGTTLVGEVACVYSTSGRTTMKFWQAGQEAELLTTDAAASCFLTEVQGGVNNFASNNDTVEIFQEPVSKYWYLGGTGNARGNAMCFNAARRGDWGASNGTADMVIDVDNNHQCGLRALGGEFISNNTQTGTWARREPGLLQWQLTATANRFGEARCVR